MYDLTDFEDSCLFPQKVDRRMIVLPLNLYKYCLKDTLDSINNFLTGINLNITKLTKYSIILVS